jgi:two-component system response regulator LytT
MKIAVCDDDSHMAAEVEEIAGRCGDITDVETEVFDSGAALLRDVDKDGSYQIYLLDVMMPGMDGFDIASKIREKDDSAVIIFITSNKEMMQKAFDVRAFNYLIKGSEPEKIEEVIRRAISYVSDRMSYFSYQKSNDRFMVRSGEIMYLESRLRKIRIITKDGEDEFYDTMDKVIKRLNPEMFARIHKSYIVNLEYVRKLSGNELSLNDGTMLGITANFQSEFNMKYRNFVIRQME